MRGFYPSLVGAGGAPAVVPSGAMATYVLPRVPGAFAFLATRPAGGPAPPNHSNRLLVNEDALPAGVAMHVAVALDFLNGH